MSLVGAQTHLIFLEIVTMLFEKPCATQTSHQHMSILAPPYVGLSVHYTAQGTRLFWSF